MKPVPLEIQNPELYNLFLKIVNREIPVKYDCGYFIDTGFSSTVKRAMPKITRNSPCYCGSGKKYKKCCGGINVKIKN